MSESLCAFPHRKIVHELKTLPAYFDAVWMGDKTFEVRRDDRGFQRGDRVKLREHDPKASYGSGRYSSREFEFTISYVLPGGDFGIEAGYVVLGMADVVKGAKR